MHVNKAAAIGLPSLLLSLGVALAAPAWAWTAIADSPSEDHVHWSVRGNQGAAEAAALGACRQTGGTGCRILASGPTCAAVSADPDGAYYHGGIGPTHEAAEADALSRSDPGAHIFSSHCDTD